MWNHCCNLAFDICRLGVYGCTLPWGHFTFCIQIMSKYLLRVEFRISIGQTHTFLYFCFSITTQIIIKITIMLISNFSWKPEMLKIRTPQKCCFQRMSFKNSYAQKCNRLLATLIFITPKKVRKKSLDNLLCSKAC